MSSSLTLEAFIFDLDGTLADSIDDIGTAVNALLAELSLPAQSMEAFKRFVGEGAEHLVRRSIRAAQGLDWSIVDDGALPRPLASLTERYRLHYAALEHRGSRAFPGIDGVLEAIARSGRPMAVLSNKRDDFTKHLVAQAFGRWHFADVRGERHGIPRKPDPRAALELAQVMKVSPAHVGFVGDTAVDMKTAANAGMQGIGVLWGFRGRDELEAAGATVCVASTDALRALVTRSTP